MSNLRNIIEAQDERNSQLAFRRAQGEIDSLTRNLERVGVEPPKAEPGFFMKALDYLDDPMNFILGGIGSLSNTPGFQDDSILEGAMRGVRQGTTTGELIRRNDIPILNSNPIVRGVTGFVGDVALDPLSWLTAGAGLGARIGGRAVTGTKVATKTDDALDAASLYRRLEGQHLAKRIAKNTGEDPAYMLRKMGLNSSDELLESASAPEFGARLFDAIGESNNLTPEMVDNILARSLRQSASDAARPFADANALFKEEKKVRRALQETKLGKKAPEVAQELADTFMKKKEAVRDTLGLKNIDDIDKLFAESGLRASSPFAPLIGSHSIELPGITHLSSKAGEVIGDAAYHVMKPVARYTSKGLDALENTFNPVAAVATGIKAARKLPKLFSKRILAGGAERSNLILEHEIGKATILADSIEDATQLFSPVRDALDDVQYKQVFSTTAQTFEEAAYAGYDEAIKKGLDDWMATSEAKRKGYRAMRESLASARLTDEQIDVVETTMRRYHNDMERIAKIESDAGILDTSRRFYFRHMFDLDDSSRRALETNEGFLEQFLGGVEAKSAGQKPDLSFTKTRKYETFAQAAEDRGLKVQGDWQDMYQLRMQAHYSAMAEKEFAERASLRMALPEDTILKIKKAVEQGNRDVNEAAFNFIGDIGLREEKFKSLALDSLGAEEVIREGGKPAAGLLDEMKKLGIKMRDDKGRWLDTERYYKLTGPGADSAANRKLRLQYGLKGNDGERLFVERINSLRDNLNKGLDRSADSRYARGANSAIKSELKRKILPSLDEDTQKWVQGALPQTFVDAISDADRNLGLGKITAKALRSSGHTQAADALEAGSNMLGSWVSALKYGVTQLWPAYHMRNLASAQFMGVDGASAIGEMFNPVYWAESYRLRLGHGKLVTKGGRVYTGKQIKKMLRDFGVINEDHLKAVDLMRMHQDAFRKYSDAIELEKDLLKAKNVKQFMKNQFAGKIDPKTGRWVEGQKSIAAFARGVENYGREHLFIQQLRRGFDPVSAAQETNRIMIDYARGKTAFERDIVNNAVFFYSFPRATLSNSLKSLVNRPGTITTQLHGVTAVQEMLRDPNAAPLPHEKMQQLLSSRGAQKIIRQLGQTSDGMAIVLENAGMPIEDLGRFLNIQTPTEMSLSSVLDAGIQSFQKTGLSVFAQLNPVIKTPMELIANKSFFFDKPLDSKFLRKFPIMAETSGDVLGLAKYPFQQIPTEVYEGIDDAWKYVLDGRDNGNGTMSVSPTKLALAELLIPGLARFKSTVLSSTNEDVGLGDRMLRLVSGVKVSEVDPLRSQVFADRERLLKIAEREGVATKSQTARRRRIEREKGR